MNLISSLCFAILLQYFGVAIHYFILAPSLDLHNLNILVSFMLIGPLKYSTLFFALSIWLIRKPSPSAILKSIYDRLKNCLKCKRAKEKVHQKSTKKVD